MQSSSESSVRRGEPMLFAILGFVRPPPLTPGQMGPALIVVLLIVLVILFITLG